jgi:hypothetical protein
MINTAYQEFTQVIGCHYIDIHQQRQGSPGIPMQKPPLSIQAFFFPYTDLNNIYNHTLAGQKQGMFL